MKSLILLYLEPKPTRPKPLDSLRNTRWSRYMESQYVSLQTLISLLVQSKPLILPSYSSSCTSPHRHRSSRQILTLSPSASLPKLIWARGRNGWNLCLQDTAVQRERNEVMSYLILPMSLSAKGREGTGVSSVLFMLKAVVLRQKRDEVTWIIFPSIILLAVFPPVCLPLTL